MNKKYAHPESIKISNGTIKRAIEKFRKPKTSLSPGDIRKAAESIMEISGYFSLGTFISESIYDWDNKELRDVEAWMIYDTLGNTEEYTEWMEMQ